MRDGREPRRPQKVHLGIYIKDRGIAHNECKTVEFSSKEEVLFVIDVYIPAPMLRHFGVDQFVYFETFLAALSASM